MKRKLILFGISGLVGIVAGISTLSCHADEVEGANQQPTTSGPRIKANGQTNSVMVGSSNTVTITVAFDVGSYPTDVAVDW